jgi:diaminopimelate decarboxylase
VAIQHARRLFDIGLQEGHNMRLLDIGGGFPGNDKQLFDKV